MSKLPDWAEAIKDLYEAGATDVEVMADRKWTKDKFDDYYTTSPGFKQLVEMGRMMSKAWWYKQARENLKNRQFNASVYALYMKNNFGWAEKEVVTAKDPQNMSSDELKSEFAKVQKEIAKTLKADGMSDARVLQSLEIAA